MFQAAHHFYNTIDTLMKYDSPDFKEFMAHHISTLSTILYCYFTNTGDNGICVMLCHDMSDAVLNIAKIFRHS
jgi:hypothetical protein